jgi:hypothetical protein
MIPLTTPATQPIPEVIESPGERFTYQVASRKKEGKRYRVDLTANNGGMWCACADFAARRQPALDRGEPKLAPATTCHHTRQALRHFNLSLLPNLERNP